jgi:hypothetical protein
VGPSEDPDGLLTRLAAWAASQSTAQRAKERSRTRSLAEQSLAAAEWNGLLLDLTEARAHITVTLTGATTLAGRLAGMGRDFVHIHSSSTGRSVLIALDAIASLTRSVKAPRSIPPAGADRRPAHDLTFTSALEALAGERSPVSLHLRSADRIDGDLVALGSDFLTLAPPPPNTFIHVPLAALGACELR